VLLDPWMVDDPDSAGRIAALDRNLDPWRKVLVPWSTADPQTTAHAQVLRAKLQLTMPRSMASWRRFARAATRDLGSLADFGHALPSVIEQLWSSYIKAVRLKTPHGEYAGRPRLDPGALPPLAEPEAAQPTEADDE
jgi:FxsC-like protein